MHISGCSLFNVITAEHVNRNVIEPTKGPSLYYVSIFLAFLDPNQGPYQHKYSTEGQQNWPFSRPTSRLLT